MTSTSYGFLKLRGQNDKKGSVIPHTCIWAEDVDQHTPNLRATILKHAHAMNLEYLRVHITLPVMKRMILLEFLINLTGVLMLVNVNVDMNGLNAALLLG